MEAPKEFPKWLDEVLKKQFEMIDIQYKRDLVSEKDWYTKHSWTEEQQTAFKNWLTAYFKKKFKFAKKYAEKEAGMFILSFGWTTKEIIDGQL